MDDSSANNNSVDVSFEKRQIVRSLSGFDDFPVLNPRTMRIISMLREKFININKLAMIMERNKTFRNHFVALSGVPEIGEDTVKEAMRAMGLLNTKHLISAFLIMPLYTYNDRDEWDHVYTTSILICNMIKHYRLPESSSLPITALLHDIGIPLLRRFTPHRYDQIKRYARENNLILEEVEEANLYISHAVATGICIRKWNLPDDVFIPASYHHTHEKINESEEFLTDTYLLQYADWVDHKARDLPCHRPDPRRLSVFGFREEDEQYWLDYQRILTSSISFAGIRNEMDSDIFNLKSSFGEFASRLVSPLGYVEKLRREEALRRQEEEQRLREESKPSFLNIAKIIKEKIQKKKESAPAQPMDFFKTSPGHNISPSQQAPAQDPETQTQVFSRPKAEKPTFNFDENKPLRLRSNGKVLETATRVFKRPNLDDKTPRD